MFAKDYQPDKAEQKAQRNEIRRATSVWVNFNSNHATHEIKIPKKRALEILKDSGPDLTVSVEVFGSLRIVDLQPRGYITDDAVTEQGGIR